MDVDDSHDPVYKGAHFATFPEALVEPCVLAGCRPGDWAGIISTGN